MSDAPMAVRQESPWLAPGWRLLPWMARLPGSALALLVALSASFVAQSHGGPTLLYALFFGVAFHFLSHDGRIRQGLDFCARGVLRLGVGLLGARITAEQIMGLGWQTAAVVVLAVLSTLLLGTWLGQKMGMSRAQGVLSGGAVAICGASAALAISAVLPRERDSDRSTLMVVVTVTVLSTVAMVLYPLLVRALGLPPALGGLFLGGTIHDVAQVVGAGYTIDQATGDIATIVKLFRVSMLALVVAVIAAVFRRERALLAQDHEAASPGLLPWFLWLFVALVAINSLGWLPPQAQHTMGDLSRGCLVLAIGALGMKTSFAQLAQAGWRPFALLLIETLWMAALVLLCIGLLRA